MDYSTMPDGDSNVLVQRALAVLAQADVGAIRREDFLGVEHTVIPVIALVEGVHRASNSPSPELALASEFGKHPQSWTGRPVTLDHPERDGSKVSANSPDVLEEDSFGMVFNTTVESSKLKMEAWINPERVMALGGEFQDTVTALEAGEVIEVSTGFFLSLDPSEGRFNGEAFEGIWRDIVPDHLAILPPGKTGACSIADGCGTNRMNSDCGCEGDCALQSRRYEVLDMPVPNTPAPGGPLQPDPEVVVIPDPTHRSMNVEGDERPWFARFAEVYHRFVNLFGSSFTVASLSDNDTRTAIDIALQADGSPGWRDIVAVFADDGEFVYFLSTWEEDGFFRRSFEIAADGTVTLGDDQVQVRPVTEFVPVNTDTRENAMSKKDMVDALIANERTRFTEESRPILEGLDEAALAFLEPMDQVEPEPDPDPDLQLNPDPDSETTAEKLAAASAPPKTADEYIAAAPDGIKGVLTEGLARYNEEHTFFVAGLVACERSQYTKAELEGKDLSELRKMARLAAVPDFRGAAGATSHLALVQGGDSPDSEQPDPPPQAFGPDAVQA